MRNKGFFFDSENFWMVFLGFIFAFGVFATHKAIQINLSRTFIVNQFNGIISIIFAAIFLAEYRLFDPGTLGGVLLILAIPLSIWSLILMRGFGKGEIGKSWVIWCVVFSLVVSFALFLVKVLVMTTPPLEVLFFQYIGSFIFVSIVNLLAKKSILLGSKQTMLGLLVGVFMSTALSFLYEAFSLAPLAYVQTAQKIGVTITAVLVGLLIFKEKKTLNLGSIIGMLVGFVSVVLVVVSNLLGE